MEREKSDPVCSSHMNSMKPTLMYAPKHGTKWKGKYVSETGF